MKRTALVALICLVALTPAAGEAAKGKAKKSCPKGAFCVWTKPNYEGKRKVFKEAGTYNLGKFNNRVSSVKSKWAQGDLAYLYERRGGEGDFRCFSQGSDGSDLGHPNWSFDNEGSSVLLPDGDGPICF